MYGTYTLRPMNASWVGVFSCDFSSKLGKVEVEGQLKEKERSVISGGPLAGQLRVLEKKGAQIGCLGVLRGLYIVLSNYIGLIS